jgi:hypothetical protein
MVSWRTTVIGIIVILAVIGFNAYTLVTKDTWSGESILTALAAIGLFFSRDTASSKKAHEELKQDVKTVARALDTKIEEIDSKVEQIEK